MNKGKKKDYFVFNRLELNYNVKWFQSNIFGFSFFNFNLLKKRLECLKNYEYEVFIDVLKQKLPVYFFYFSNKLAYTIFFLDLVCSYRGYRHCRGLPVRGQRTWTNANSCYNSNTILRQFRIFYFKKLLGTNSVNFASQSHMSEQINLLWKIQWDVEWRESRRKQKRMNQDKKKGGLSIDLQAMSKGDVSGFTRRGSAAKKKLYKQKKSQFTLGFDVGFTKNISTDNNTFILNEK